MTPAPLEIIPTRWTWVCRDCGDVLESDDEWLNTLELCGRCAAERGAEQVRDIERDEASEEEQP